MNVQQFLNKYACPLRMQSTCEYNCPRYIKVLVKRVYDDFMDECHGIFLWTNLIAFPATEMKMNDQENPNSGSNESLLHFVVS